MLAFNMPELGPGVITALFNVVAAPGLKCACGRHIDQVGWQSGNRNKLFADLFI